MELFQKTSYAKLFFIIDSRSGIQNKDVLFSNKLKIAISSLPGMSGKVLNVRPPSQVVCKCMHVKSSNKYGDATYHTINSLPGIPGKVLK
jgi:hypothetical protein